MFGELKSPTAYGQDVQQLVIEGKLPEAAALAKSRAIESLLSAALIYAKLGDEQAVKLSKISIDLDSNNPNLYGNLSFFLGNQMRCEEALEAIDRAIALMPNNAPFLHNKAILLSSLKRIDESIEYYRKELALTPDCHVANFNLGCTLCLSGQYREALPLLEYRFKYDGDLAKFRSRFNKPDWNPSIDLAGKRLLLFSEQGMGDVIQYVRYVPQLRKKGAILIAEIQEKLASLLSGFFDITIGRDDDFNVEQPADLPEYDYVVSFSSLPFLLDPDLSRIPKTPYLFAKDSDFHPDPDKLNVGIVWAGSAVHTNDVNRSCPVKHFAPLAMEGIQIYSLQKGSLKRDWFGKPTDLGEGFSELNAIDLAGRIDDLNAAAQFIIKLDLIITVDTAIAHLAGALGKNVWVLLPFCHDHRWLLNGRDTIWYKSMRLFHQQTTGDWDGVAGEVVKELSDKS